MKISFDLDDTLICYEPEGPYEPSCVPLWWRWRNWEPLRLGAAALLRELQQNHEIWIYTTSYREPRDVKRWLGFYGVQIHTVINGDIHAREVRSREWSKLPSHFGIALHVDDEDWRVLGERFGFEWMMVKPEDEQWAHKVRDVVAKLASSRE